MQTFLVNTTYDGQLPIWETILASARKRGVKINKKCSKYHIMPIGSGSTTAPCFMWGNAERIDSKGAIIAYLRHPGDMNYPDGITEWEWDGSIRIV